MNAIIRTTNKWRN